MASGESSNLTLGLKNIAVQALGRDHRRPVKVVVWANQPNAGAVAEHLAANTIMPANFVFFEDSGQVADAQLVYPGYTHEFAALQPRQLKNFRRIFQLLDAPAYAGGELRSAICQGVSLTQTTRLRRRL